MTWYQTKPGHWKTTSMKDDLNGRQPQWKTKAMEDDLKEGQAQWIMTSMEDNVNWPQLFYWFFSSFRLFQKVLRGRSSFGTPPPFVENNYYFWNPSHSARSKSQKNDWYDFNEWVQIMFNCIYWLNINMESTKF